MTGILGPAWPAAMRAPAFCLALAAAGWGTLPAAAEERPGTFNLHGGPGLIDMPGAGAVPEATLSGSFAGLGGTTRTVLRFQFTPRLAGTFRYSALEDFVPPGETGTVFHDRSFDLEFRLLDEGRWRPALVAGIRDITGTGLYGAEYLVAGKRIGPGLELTAGLGWGRLGSRGALGETGRRPASDLGREEVDPGRWFRGPLAAFGGLSWSPNPSLTLKAEYSSDAYTAERAWQGFRPRSPWSFGLDWRTRSGMQLSLYHAYGDTVGAQFTFHLNPRRAIVPGGLDPAPVPVRVRPADGARPRDWVGRPKVMAAIDRALGRQLAAEGIAYRGIETDGRRATVRIRNLRYLNTAQALGRTLRVMARVLPDSVEILTVVPETRGMGAAAITQRRSDLEALEFAPSAAILARTGFADAHGRLPPLAPAAAGGRFSWGIVPYVSLTLLDPDSPLGLEGGLRARARYEITPHLTLSGVLRKPLVGNLDEIGEPAPSPLPRVRSTLARFRQAGDPALDRLTLTGHARLGPELYGRVSLGLLETMYAGLAGEVLWKPVTSPLALGVELAAVRQRAHDGGFGLQDCARLKAEENFTDCTLLTGHVSAYYAFGNGFHARLDVGRYLAGDLGATLGIDREFANGWRVGAFATVTDAPGGGFGDEAFAKGIRVTIPLGWATGRSSTTTSTLAIAPIPGDAGARLDTGEGLYEAIRHYHEPDLRRSWGRFWR